MPFQVSYRGDIQEGKGVSCVRYGLMVEQTYLRYMIFGRGIKESARCSSRSMRETRSVRKIVAKDGGENEG